MGLEIQVPFPHISQHSLYYMVVRRAHLLLHAESLCRFNSPHRDSGSSFISLESNMSTSKRVQSPAQVHLISQLAEVWSAMTGVQCTVYSMLVELLVLLLNFACDRSAAVT